MNTRLNVTIQFGLVNIPVGVCMARKEKKFSLRNLHSKCGTPVTVKKWCPKHDKPVDDELVSAWEAAPGQFVTLTEAEKDKLKAARSKVVAISKFITPEEFDRNLIKNSYWLQPGKSDMSDAYSLFYQALVQTGRIALGTSVLWGKEEPTIVEADNGALVVRVLFCHDELVQHDVQVNKPNKEMLAIAVQLIEGNSAKLDAKKDLVSKNKDQTEEFLAKKSEGIMLAVEQADEQKPTVDLMEALKQSVDAASKKPRRKKVAA